MNAHAVSDLESDGIETAYGMFANGSTLLHWWSISLLGEFASLIVLDFKENNLRMCQVGSIGFDFGI